MKVCSYKIINDIQLNIIKISDFFKNLIPFKRNRDFFYPEEKIDYLKSLDRQDRWPPYR
ncbi:MAG: hypothetical protein GY714_30105 [Desulfobacterales bacterium]|nr:hypothetical protein [Desulfobacterales bacterium]